LQKVPSEPKSIYITYRISFKKVMLFFEVNKELRKPTRNEMFGMFRMDKLCPSEKRGV